MLCKAGADLTNSTIYLNSVDNVEVNMVMPDNYPEGLEELPDDEEDDELAELLGLDSDDCIDWDDDE